MTRKPSLVAIIWGLAFIAMAGLAVLQELKVLTTMTVFGLLAPLGLIVLGLLGLVLSNRRDSPHCSHHHSPRNPLQKGQ